MGRRSKILRAKTYRRPAKARTDSCEPEDFARMDDAQAQLMSRKSNPNVKAKRFIEGRVQERVISDGERNGRDFCHYNSSRRQGLQMQVPSLLSYRIVSLPVISLILPFMKVKSCEESDMRRWRMEKENPIPHLLEVIKEPLRRFASGEVIGE